MTLRNLRFLTIAGVLVAAVGLAACYVPDKFQSEVTISKTGDYRLLFYGNLAWEPFHSEALQGKHTPAEIDAEVASLTRDLSRDKDFSELKSLGNGAFQVRYKREGHLAADDEVAFVRRNDIIMEIRSKADGTISIDGAAIKPADAQRLATAGVSTSGEFHVTTDGLVQQNNANQIKRDGPFMEYIWIIKDAFTPAPHFVMQREGVFPKK